MNRMFSIIFFSPLCAILQVRNNLTGMLAAAAEKPSKERVCARDTSGVLEGGRVGVWPTMPYLGTEESRKSLDLSL